MRVDSLLPVMIGLLQHHWLILQVLVLAVEVQRLGLHLPYALVRGTPDLFFIAVDLVVLLRNHPSTEARLSPNVLVR